MLFHDRSFDDRYRSANFLEDASGITGGVSLPTLEELSFSRLSLSNRGANLLLSAVSEIAPRLKIVNGIPLTNLMHEKKGVAAD